MVRRVTPALIAIVIAALLSSADTAAAQDWPQWRGPNRAAKATGFAAPATWPKELTKKWQVPVGDGVATPALVGGKLYVFTLQNGKEIVRCLDAASGNEVWQKSYETEGATGPAGGFAGPRCSPTFADGRLVTFGVRGMLTCFDAASGDQLWQKNDFPESWPMFFTSSSPIVVDGVCVTQQGGRRDGGVIAYELASGAEKWRWMEAGPSYGSPVVMEVDGTKVIIAPTDGKLVALGAADGKLLWEMPYSQGRYNSATPIVDGSTLILAGPGSGMTAFKMQKQGDKLVEEKLWANTDNSLGFNTPVVAKGLLFGLSSGNQLFCINTETKTTAWSAPIAKAAPGVDDPPKESAGASRGSVVPAAFVQFVQQEGQQESKNQPADRPRGELDRGPRRGQGFGRFGRGGMGSRGYGSIVDVGSALVALTPAGELVVFQSTGDAFNELARYKVAERGTYAYPIPAGNGVYVKDQDALTLWTVE